MILYLLYKNYRFSSGIKFWFQRKFTPAGALFVTALFLTGGIGVDTNQAMAFQAFTLLSCLLAVALVWSFFRAPLLYAERTLPRAGTAGQPLQYRMTVTNPTAHLQASITVGEDLGDPRPTYRQFADTPEPGERRRNWFDRFFRFYRWLWIIAQRQIAVSVPASLPVLSPGKSVEINMMLVPKQRGHLYLPGVSFSVTDPFGLCRSYSCIAAAQSVLILPKRYLLPNVSLGGAAQYQPGGVSLASSLGESEEFMSVREYRQGDPLRHVHWKSSSKTGKLIVKEFQNEFFVRQALILDTFLEDSASPVFEEAVSIAASFALTLNTQETLLDLLFVGTEAICVSAGYGVAQVEHLLRILASVQPCTGQSFSALEEIVFRQIALVSGCVCIFLKWDEERKSLVEQLSSMAVPQLVLILKKAGEREPVIKLQDHRYVKIHIIDTAEVEKGLAKL
jgi:uncharacterized protein (DUF58 family)